MREFSSLNTNKYIPSDTMKNLIIKFEVFKIRILLILFFVTNSIWSQCPTVLNNNQIFCDSDLATVGSLMAQDNGGGVVWYNSATGIVPLANFEPLQNGNIYYADNASGSCAERVGVVVTILSAPAGPNFQGFCVTNLEDATVNSLLAIGLGIQWFATPFGGTPLDPSTILSTGSLYFASQTNPQSGCLSSRLAVFVTVGTVEAPTGETNQSICFDDPNNPPTILDLVASGDNNWYISSNATVPLSPLTLLVDGQTYYATTNNPPCESVERLAVTVSLLPVNNAGIGAVTNFCESQITSGESINLLDLLGGNPSNSGVWSGDLNSANGGLGTIAFSQFNLAGSPYEFIYTVSDNDLCPIATSTIIVNIDELFSPGENFDLSICSNEDPLDLFSLIPGNPSPNGIWSPSLSSGDNIFNPAIDVTGTYTYTVNQGSSCPVLFSVANITVTETSDAGESNTITICDNIGTFELTTLLNGTPELIGTWSPPLASGTNTFDPLLNPSGIYTYTIESNTTCPDSFAVLNLTIETAAYAGEDTIVEVCSNDSSFDLRTLLGGNPDQNGFWTPALSSGNNLFDPANDLSGNYTYTVEGFSTCEDDTATINITISEEADAGISASVTICLNDTPLNLFQTLSGTPQQSGIWTPDLAEAGFFNPSVDTPGIYTYTVLGIGNCEDAQATVIIDIEENPNAGNDTFIEICTTDAPFDLFASLNGNPDAGGTWTPELSSGSNIFNPLLDVAGAYTYTVSGTLNCSADSAIITVNVNTAVYAGEDSQISLCSNDLPINLFESLNGLPDSGGIWTPATNVEGFFDPAIDMPGTYTYFISGNGICPDDAATIEIEIVLPPNAGSEGAIAICSDAPSFNLTNSLGGNPDLGGVWSPALASGTSIFNPLIDNSGVYTYTVFASNSCGQDVSQVTVTVSQAANSGQETTITICEGNPPISLTNALQGNPDLNGVWSPLLSSGTDIFDPAVDASGNYFYVVQGEFPCSNSATVLTINIEPELNAGEDGQISLCSNDNPINLYDVLGGNPQVGGVWSPALTSGTGVFNPAVDFGGVYTYTITGNTFCQDANSIVTVTLNEAPNVGVSTTIEICIDSAPFNLISFLGSEVDLNGTWSPALSSGTQVFDPSVDPSGLYTYTIQGEGACEAVSSTLLINFNETPDAGQSNSIIVCSNDAPVNLFDFLLGTPNINGTWTPTLSGNNGIFNPGIDSEGIYIYTISGNGICDDATASIQVTIENQLNAGNDVSIELCESSPAIDLFTLLGGSPDVGGAWTPALSSASGVFDPSIDNAGVYTYTIPATANCSEISSTVSVAVVLNQNAGEDANIEICENDAPVDLFTFINGNPDLAGTWTPTLTSGSGVFDPSIDTAGEYTYTINANDLCSADFSVVTVVVIPDQSAGQNGQITVCQDAPLFDLTTILQGNPLTSGTWSPELNSGTNIFNPAIDFSAVYTYTVSTPCGTSTAEVVVSIELISQAGNDAAIVVCANASPINLFDELLGNPALGGVWTPALASGSGVFDPSVDLAGTYTYTTGTGSICGPRSATVTVSLEQPISPGISNTITICQNSTNINLFNLLGNTASPGGTWSPGLVSGTNIYNPQSDGSGVFTYTVGGTANCNPSQSTITINFIPSISSGIFEGLQQVCVTETSFDLFSLLDGSQTSGGIWLNGSGNIITNIINPSLLTTNTFQFVYLISNSCLSTSTIVQMQVVPLPTLSQNNIGIDSPICLGESASILISSIPNGNYSLEIESLGANIFATTDFEVTVENGFGIFTIAANLLTNVGETVFQFNNITNIATGCSNTVENVEAILTILPNPTLSAEQVEIENICLGENLSIVINNANQLTDGNYTFQYEISGPNTFISESGNVLIENGQAVFEIEGSLLSEVGNFNFSVLQILNTDTGCLGSVNVTIPFVINNLPVFITPEVTFSFPEQCINLSNIVTIDFGLALPNGDYEMTYSLSGAVVLNTTETITVNNGIATIEFSESILISEGLVTFELLGFDFFTNICGTSSVLSATQTFDIQTTPTPILLSEIPVLCEEDATTIEVLNDYVFANDNVITWYDAPIFGNVLSSDTPLQNGFTYYAAAISDLGCESIDRLSVEFVIETCIVNIFIPDGFSPNNDGINDRFEILHIRDLYPNFTIEIFNRYGNVIFRGNASIDDWAGDNNQGGIKLDNGVLPNGVYFYIINFNDGATETKQGRVYLNR